MQRGILAGLVIIGLVAAAIGAQGQALSPPNSPPGFIEPTPADGSTITIPSGQMFSVTVKAQDPEQFDRVSLSTSALPPGAAFNSQQTMNPVQGTLSWMPQPGVTGPFVITFTATDDKGNSASTSITVNVSVSTNHPPTFVMPPTPNNNRVFVVGVGQPLQFNVKAQDQDAGDVVSLTATGLPGNATFTVLAGVYPIEGAFNWTPNSNQPGAQWTISFTARDTAGAQRMMSVIVMLAPPFSWPDSPPDGVCVCSLVLPHNGPPQNWFIRADNSGTMSVSLFAFSSDPTNEPAGGSVQATIFDANNVIVGTIANVPFPTDPMPGLRAENSGAATFTTAAGAIYRLQVNRFQQQGLPAPMYRSYRFETLGATEAATPSSLMAYGVSPPDADHMVRWGLSVAAEENLRLSIGYPGNLPVPAPQVKIRLIDPFGVARPTESMTVTVPATINLQDAGNTPGRWRLEVLDAPNHIINKQSGPDRAIYLTWVNGGSTTDGRFDVSVSTASPNGLKPIALTLTNNTTGEVYAGTSAPVSGPGPDPDGRLVFPLAGFSGQFPAGSYSVTASVPPGRIGYTVTPAQVDADLWCQTVVPLQFVIDYPPVITELSASPGVLWPPNHKMVDIALNVTATDDAAAAPVCRVVSVSSNEPWNGTGDGNTNADYSIDGMKLSLRAERAGTLTDRIYTVGVQCKDLAGNDSLPTYVPIVVPHDMGKK